MNYLYNELTEKIIGLSISVHKELGPGLLENVYKQCLAYELSKANIDFQLEVECPVFYKDIKINCGYRIDILVENKIILELKSVDKLIPVYDSQLLTYMKLFKLKLGLLINFNEKILKDGIKRLIL
ncbi:MAG TPA: GxxExxY protein [Spirochaetota bacterium]|nr:GxxExxY protein [Spirochaetota bacterium]